MAASLLGMLTVIAGALGAHALKPVLSADSLKSFETAVRYSAWHAIALLALFSVFDRLKRARYVTLLWFLGALLFSGSIYLLSTRELSGLQVSFLGPVTPLGGLLMIMGWFLLFWEALGMKK